MSEDRDPESYKVFVEIAIIEQLARNKMERVLPDGMTMSQFAVLNHLCRLSGEWAPARLARAFQVTKAAMTNTLGRLQARGLIEIVQDPKDKRAKIVLLKDEGRQVRAQCLREIVPVIQKMEANLPDGFIGDLLPGLVRLREFLDNDRNA